MAAERRTDSLPRSATQGNGKVDNGDAIDAILDALENDEPEEAYHLLS